MSQSLAARLVLCCAVGLGSTGAWGADPISRTWSDATGRFKVKGTFVSLDGNNVTIRQENGKEVEVPLRKLNPADQAFAKQAAESASENPFKEKDAGNPFTPKESASGSGAGLSDDAPLVREAVIVDWARSQAVDPQPEHSNWSEGVKGANLADGAEPLKPKTIRLPNRADFFERAKAVAFSPNGEKAVAGYTLRRPGVGQPATTRLVLIDLKTGKTLGSGQTDGEFVPLGLSDDGRRMLVRRDGSGFGGSDSLEVWGLAKSGIQRGPMWPPYADQDGPRRDVKWGTIVADGRALTLGGSGRLALWDLETVAPVWHLDLPRDHAPALSPNGKYLAYAAQNEVGLLDVEAGKVLATLPAEHLLAFSLAFSPDGRRLAARTGNTLLVWDVATGELYREIYLGLVGGLSELSWTDAEHVLLGGSTLIHVESRVPMWQYTGGASAVAARGAVWFLVTGHNSGDAVVGAVLPHDVAKRALASAQADPNFFVLKPDAVVDVDVSGVPKGDRATVSELVRKSVLAAGFKIAATAPVTAKATMTRGETRQISYRGFGSLNSETHSVQEYVVELALVAGGKDLWKTRVDQTPAPHMVSLKQGETVADVLKQYDKPGYEFLGGVHLPKFLPRQFGKPTLGTSGVAAQGIR